MWLRALRDWMDLDEAIREKIGANVAGGLLLILEFMDYLISIVLADCA